MAKQLTVVFIVTVLFSLTWVLVIFQFVRIDDNAEISIEEINEYEEMNNVNEETTRIEKVQELNDHHHLSNITNENVEGENERLVVDLRDYDFSDVASTDGVPIDAILMKLGIR